MSTKSFVCNRVNKQPDFNTLAYQLQVEKELSSGHLNQAVYDFSQAIERNPTSPLPYLERGVAHFGLGEEAWRNDHNQVRPHSSLRVKAPEEFLAGLKEVQTG